MGYTTIRRDANILKALVHKEIIKSFHKSVFGVFWHLIVPTLQLYIFFHVYGYINQQNNLKATISGLLLWFLFNNAVPASIQLVRSSTNLMRQLKVKVYLLTASSVTMSLIYSILFLLTSAVFMIVNDVSIRSGAIAGVFVILLFCFFTFSVSVIISIGNLFFRDLGKLWSPMSFLIFLTAPILYPKNVFPGFLKYLSELNPLTQFIESLRLCLNQDFSIAVTLVPWSVLITITLLFGIMAFVIVRVTNKSLIANL